MRRFPAWPSLFLLGPAFGIVLALIGLGGAVAQPRPVAVVAAENVYGDVATQLGGASVAVTSILSNPNQDPHLFEASPATARALAGADIVVSNGLDYDPWMARLLRASPGRGRQEIVIADLLHRSPGDNPHLWYDPACMSAYASALTAALDRRDPAHAADHAVRLQAFLVSMKALQERVLVTRARFEGVAVTATEPVFGLMASALGLNMRNQRFQMAVMNNTEPSASDVAAFEADLRGRKVRALIYNAQVDDPSSRRLLALAKKLGVPVVPVTETEPAGTTYQEWMTGQLDALDRALAVR